MKLALIVLLLVAAGVRDGQPVADAAVRGPAPLRAGGVVYETNLWTVQTCLSSMCSVGASAPTSIA